MDPNITVSQPSPPPQRPDGVVLHFLKELPGVVWVAAMLIFFTVVYLYYRDDFIPRIIDALIGAFLGLVVGQRMRVPAQQQSAVQTDNIESVDINQNGGPSKDV